MKEREKRGKKFSLQQKSQYMQNCEMLRKIMKDEVLMEWKKVMDRSKRIEHLLSMWNPGTKTGLGFN